MLLVPMDGGAARVAFFVVLDCVLADGGSSLVTASRAARWRLRALRRWLVLALPIRSVGRGPSSCVGDATFVTLGSDGSLCCCSFCIDHVIGPSTLGSACSVGGC